MVADIACGFISPFKLLAYYLYLDKIPLQCTIQSIATSAAKKVQQITTPCTLLSSTAALISNCCAVTASVPPHLAHYAGLKERKNMHEDAKFALFQLTIEVATCCAWKSRVKMR
jgi:hypothetical protein